MAVVTMRQMLEAGVHFGHQTRRWNPKMKRFIFGERGGIYIIDLEQTLVRAETAYQFVRDLSAKGGTVMFIGTKKQAQDPVRSFADKVGMPYVNERWLGGMLTNFETIAKRTAKMQEYERMRAAGDFEAMPKKGDKLKLDGVGGSFYGVASVALDVNKDCKLTEADRGGWRDSLGLPYAVSMHPNLLSDAAQAYYDKP